MATIESAIAVLLDANVATLTLGVNLFTGPVRPISSVIPGLCAFVQEWGGESPMVFADGNAGANLRVPSVIIRVRSTRHDYSSGSVLKEEIYSALERAVPSDTIGITPSQSSPIYLGEDEEGHHEWSINIRGYKYAGT